jgi:hypothetical protein
MNTERNVRAIRLDHAWKYFDRHATQRLQLFNFYLVVSGLLLTALAASLEGRHSAMVGGALGSLMVLFSYVFLQLDRRTQFLIKLAEYEILEVEQAEGVEGIFSREPQATADRKAAQNFLLRQWSYRESFRLVYGVVAICGLVGILVSVFML